MLTTVALATALLTTPQAADKWDLKGLAPNTSSTWDVQVKVTDQGEEHEATFKLIMDLKEVEKEKPFPATYSWKSLVVDGGQEMGDTSWNIRLSPRGLITEGADGDDAIRRMLSPLVFVFPDKPVGVGDTWTETVKAGTEKDDQSLTVEFKAEAIEKVKDADTMKISEKLTEKGSEAMTAEGTWWVDKDGKVVKFETKTKKWYVPLASQSFDATIKGELAK